MPWTAADADKHIHGLTDKQKRAWAHIANSALKACMKRGGTECDASAMRQAAAAAKRVTEAMTPDQIDDIIREALHASDSLDTKQQKLSQAIRNAYAETDLWPWIRDTFAENVVYSLDGDLFQRSYTIDESGAVTLGDPIEVEIVYQPKKKDAQEAADLAVEGDVIPLIEKAVNTRDGTIRIKLISPGQGSSGYYPKETLKRDGPKLFKKGTQMFWDHQTDAEEADRPEGSLRNLAAVLESDASYEDHPKDGPGLYAVAKPFGHYREAIDELAPHIGVSIRAYGKAETGQVAGKPTRIVKELTAARSVDFVTQAGAGGKIQQLFEAARSRQSQQQQEGEDVDAEQLKKLNERLDSLEATNKTLKVENDRLQEALQIREARDVVDEALNLEEVKALNLTTRAVSRVRESVLRTVPLKDGKIDAAKLTESVKTVAKDEAAYLSEATGQIKGMGAAQGSGSTAPDVLAEAKKTLDASIGRLTGRKEAK